VACDLHWSPVLPIDFRDAFIGAIASVKGSVLLTRNVGHFGRFLGVRLGELM
jgi:predicted nucleic acid-binding protein